MTSKRVLLVEDEALIALYTAETLTDAGYDVVGPADRLESALALAETEQLDAAVLDVNLAGIQVWPVANVLHQRGVPFVLLTGFGSSIEVPATCRAAQRLDKPFNETVLLNALQTIVGRPV